MARLIDADATISAIETKMKTKDTQWLQDICELNGLKIARALIYKQPTIEPVKHGQWIDCDYKTLEHGEIESAYKAGLCCSECRTGFKKNHMIHKAFCPACGAKMDGGENNAAG